MCWYSPTILSCGCVFENERNIRKVQCREQEDRRFQKLQVAIEKDRATGQGTGSTETIKAQNQPRKYCKIIMHADGDSEFVTNSSVVCQWHEDNPGMPKPQEMPIAAPQEWEERPEEPPAENWNPVEYATYR
ncbi:hypothetical protein IFR05_013671 [Cadophora sp. M221]|nr:hypothetical protein IFR05_013671 [Cadophora sp. M221]